MDLPIGRMLAVSALALAAQPARPASAASLRAGGFELLQRLDAVTAPPPGVARWRSLEGRAALVAAVERGRARGGSGRLLVAVRNGRALAPALAALPPGAAVVERSPRLGIATVTGDPAAVAAALAGRADVEQVTPAGRRRPAAEPLEALDPDTARPFAWHLEDVHALAALAHVPGGRGVPVAVIDTGVARNVSDLPRSVIVARRSFVTSGFAATDRLGHGTFIAGLISAVVDGHGTRGVAGPTPILAAKVDAANGDIDTLAEARAMVWAIDRGARVLNLSNAGFCPLDVAEQRGLAYALRHDVLVVAAAGNEADSGSGNPVECPAAWLGARRGAWSPGLSVGASTPDRRRAPFSEYNLFLSLAAPGAGSGDDCKGVISTLPVGGASLFPPGACARPSELVGGREQTWAYAQGTSFATPIVVGVAALVRRVRPDLSAQQVGDILERPVVGGSWTTRLGWGIVDAGLAVHAARTYDSLPPTFTHVSASLRSPGRLVLDVRARDGARRGETVARGPLEYRVDLRVRGRWRRLAGGVERPSPTRAVAVPAVLSHLCLRVRVKDDHLNVSERIVRV